MTDETKRATGIIVICVILLVVLTFSPTGIRAWRNRVNYNLRKLDESTRYESLKNVEDTARGMIASYEADYLTWKQYKDSTDREELSWAAQARMRANTTASTYNNYLLQNSFVWADNIPRDIRRELATIE
ncbi:hypothetical protein AGMMS49992_31160 [Clostridia bacterium]|nr:hypothetical protein AGMMS49992_31160 [Clostridia bacterium]